MDDGRFERAIELRNQGKEEDALREFEAMAEVTPNPQEAGSLLLNQANCLWRLGRLKEARERLSDASILWTSPFTEFVDACLCVTEGKTEEAVRKLYLF